MNQLPLLTSETGGDGARVIAMPRLSDLRALADGPLSSPEWGKRTPQLDIRRYTPRSFADLELADVKTILRRARRDGRTEDLADLWATMMEDAHLDSVWQTFLAPIITARWELAPAEVAEELSVAAEVATEGCTEALQSIDMTPAISALLDDGEGIGYGVAEIEWGVGRLLGKPATVPVRVTPVLARRFAFSDSFEIGLWDQGTAVEALRGQDKDPDVITGRGTQMVRLPAGKYIVHQPMRFHTIPTGRGVIFAVAKWWWIKQIVAQSALQGAEAFANPRFIASVEQAAGGDAVVDELLDGLESFATDGVAVLRGKTKIDVIDSKGEGAAKTWEMYLKYCDAALSKGVIGSTLNVEVGDTGGNRSLGESQADQTIDPRRGQAAAALWTSIRRDLLSYVVRFNPHIFVPGSPAPMGRSVFAEEPVEVDDAVINSGYLKVNQLLESRGLPPLPGDAGEAFLPRPAAPSRPFSAQAPEVAASADPFALTANAISRAVSGTPSPTS